MPLAMYLIGTYIAAVVETDKTTMGIARNDSRAVKTHTVWL